MRLIGYWMESLKDARYLPPQIFVGDTDCVRRELVADYLDAGDVFSSYRGQWRCEFGCDRRVYSRELTDGTYVWPEDLGHYVRDHSIRLPPEVVEHISSRPTGVHPFTRSVVDTSVTPDTAFWASWCDANRTEAFEAKRQAALARADAEFAIRKAEMLVEQERAEGLSHEICCQAGCDRPALLRRSFCAECIEPDWETRLAYIYRNLDSLFGD